MPDDGSLAVPPDELDEFNDAGSARYDRPSLVAFVTDARSEEAVRDGLSEVRSSNWICAVATCAPRSRRCRRSTTPTGAGRRCQRRGPAAERARRAVARGRAGCPRAGDRRVATDVDFYREITRGLGAAEYLPKPLTRDMVARHFGRRPARQRQAPDGVHGRAGRHRHRRARRRRRHHDRGQSGLAFRRTDAPAHGAARSRPASRHRRLHVEHAARRRPAPALEAPERIDALLAERAAQPVADRLHVLAGEEKLVRAIPTTRQAPPTRCWTRCGSRYNFIVVDVPFAPVPLYRDLLDLVHQRVLVMEPTLAAVRDTLRLLALPDGAGATAARRDGAEPRRHSRRTERAQVEEALKMKVDVADPGSAAAGRQRRDPGRTGDGISPAASAPALSNWRARSPSSAAGLRGRRQRSARAVRAAAAAGAVFRA